jgi:elongation factor Ts
MAISTELVKKLRERTGAPMMDCKTALVEAQGNIELALENLRKKGTVQADKLASRTAAEGTIIIKSTPDYKSAVMVEINCQTDFVARDKSFQSFAELVATKALQGNLATVEDISALSLGDGKTVDEQRQELVATLGENIQIRRIVLLHSQGTVGTYLHGDRIGVLVELSVDNRDLGKDLAMHIAASRPRAVAPEDIPQVLIAKEREIFMAQAQASGKPVDIIEKMVEGRLKKFVNEESLLGQPFVKDPEKTVGNLLASENAKVFSFTCFKVGEGIEKKVESFAEEVMAQVRRSE